MKSPLSQKDMSCVAASRLIWSSYELVLSSCP